MGPNLDAPTEVTRQYASPFRPRNTWHRLQVLWLLDQHLRQHDRQPVKTFATQAPRASDVTYAGASVLNIRQSASVTVAAGGTLVATVRLQGRGAAPQTAWSVPLTATLTRQGATTPAYALAVTTDASGVFTATAITPGTYTLRVKQRIRSRPSNR